MQPLDSFQVPEGYVLTRIGGRPKKTGRDVAVFLAKLWRMGSPFYESAASAESWILDEWEKLGKDQSKGLSEAAHVRAAVRRAKQEGLKYSLLHHHHATGLWIAIAADPVHKSPNHLGERVWFWKPGMHLALEARVANEPGVGSPGPVESPKRTEISKAVTTLFYHWNLGVTNFHKAKS